MKIVTIAELQAKNQKEKEENERLSEEIEKLTKKLSLMGEAKMNE